MIQASYYAGVDVSKLHLDVHLLPSNQATRLPNTAAGHRQLITLLQSLTVQLVVLEASGGYEQAAVIAMVDADLGVFVAQPQVIRHFAKSLRQRAKTDRIDAALLARYAHDHGQSLTPIAKIDPARRALQALVVRRDQLVQMRTMEANRSQQTSHTLTLKSLQRLLAYLDKEIARVEKAIDQMIQADRVLAAKAHTMRQTRGIGPQTARLLLACLPELGQAGPKRLNSLVGVAPYAQESGGKIATRHIAGGRKLVRDGLYMACMAATRSNPVIAPFYHALRQRGLAHKTAIMACIRKLLAHLDKQISLLTIPSTSSP